MFLQKNIKFVNKKYFRWFAVSTCPPGQVLAGPDMSKVRLFNKISNVLGPKLSF